MQDENNDLDAMLDNPFQNLHPRKGSDSRQEGLSDNQETLRGRTGERIHVEQSEAAESRVERNHPLEIRMLAREKNELIISKKLDDIKRIIEHQNERIRLMEEELEIIRKALGEK